MKIFDLAQLKELSSKEGELVISIYSPTQTQSTDGYKEDKLHFKNQLNKVEASLINEHGVEKEEASRILQPGHDLLNNYDFWKFSSNMLAFFSIDGESFYYRLPLEIEDSMHFIGKRPFLLPMLPELNDDGNFYLLLLNLDRIRLYEASRNHIKEIEIDPEEVAVSFSEEEERDENVQQLQGQGGVGNAGAMFHGHGEGSDEEKKVTITNYFHRMTNMLEPKLNQRPLPLFLAGVDYLIPLFQEASKYTLLQKEHVSGAYTGDEQKELHQKAWQVAEPYFSQERQGRKEEYSLREAKNLAISTDEDKLIKIAISGGVDTLYVNTDHKHKWGTFDEDNYEIHLDDCSNGKNHCLIDLAAVKVLENGGKVYFLEPGQMPNKSRISGTLRYEV